MKTFYLLLSLPVLILFSCDSPNYHKDYVLKFKGSESMHRAFWMLKSEFEQKQDSVKIILEGGGSRTGLMAIKDGSADVGLSSYRFNLDSTLGNGHGVTERVVAYDGIILISNKRNPIQQLNNEQINMIFSGSISDWSQLGGLPGQILPIVRDENSGTQKFFQNYFNIENLNPLAEIASDNKSIVSRVNKNQNGIGFIGFGYFTERIQRLEIPTSPGHDTAFTTPTFENLGQGKYPLRRPLQMYYKDAENPGLQAFLNFLGTREAQLIIKEEGLLPESENTSLIVNR
ncbi:MAG: substrate-binding domain-containing protein [Cyclobacteriaceae bacterium]